MLTNKLRCLLLLSIFSFAVNAQTTDSLAVINEIENFQFSNASSVDSFFNLYRKHKSFLNKEQRYNFRKNGIAAAKKFKKEKLYVKHSLYNINILLSESKDTKGARKGLKVIESNIESSNSNNDKAIFFTYHGMINSIEGNFVEAIENLLKGSDYYKKSENPEKAFNSIANISGVYLMLKDNENAIKYAKELLTLNEDLEPTLRLANTLNAYSRISRAYYLMEKKDSSLYYIDKALATKRENPDLINSTSEHSCCEIYSLGIRLYLELENLSKLDSLLEKFKDCKRNEPSYSLITANYFLIKKDYEQARKVLNKMEDIEGYLAYGVYKADLKARCFEGLGDYKAALKEEKTKFEIQREINKKTNLEVSKIAATRIELAKKEERVKKMEQLEVVNKKKNRLLSYAIVLVFLLFLVALYAFRKTKQNMVFLKKDLENKNVIEAQANKIKKISVERGKLFANIAHDLRNPLSLIISPIDLLLKNQTTNEEDRNLLLLAKKSSNELLNFSNQIIDVTKKDFSEIPLNLNKVQWKGILEHLLLDYKIRTNVLNINLIQKTDCSDFLLQTDFLKLKAILDNIFQNALKFSKENDSITVQTSDDENSLRIAIEDNGSGIKEEDISNVFERYYQSNEDAEDAGGFGIGLSICKEYVQKLGGEIDLQSERGVGTKVSIVIPKHIQSEESVPFYTYEKTPDISRKINKPKDRESKKILIVEDNIELSNFMKFTLSEDFQIEIANNGKEGLSKLEIFEADLVITDWMMPNMNGLEFIKAVRNHPEWHNLPVIMLTAKSFKVDQIKALRKGVDDYLLKPLDVDTLKLRINQLLEFSNGRKEVVNCDSKVNQELLNTYDIENQKDFEWILNLENIIQENIDDFDLNVEQVSLAVNLSKSQVNRKVKTIIGMTPTEFINEIRFWESRRLLEEGKVLSVKAVAYSVGFKSVKNFSMNFKKRFGKSPSEYL